MSLLTRQAQIALRVESTEGTAAAPTATHAKMLAYDLSFDPDIELFTRDPARQYLTPLQSVIGKKGGTCSWRTELKGSGTLATRPAWDAALRACGFTSNAVSAVTTGAVAGGPFVPGETITGSSSGGTGRIVGEQASSPIKYVVVSGGTAFNTDDTIVGATSGASCAVSNAPIANQGFEYRPTSSSPPSATVDRYEDGLRKRLIGARGNVTVEGNSGEPVFLNFSFDGVYDAVTDTALLSVTYESTNPPVLLDAGASVSGLTMVWTQLNLDMQNVLARRTDANNANGYLSTLITGRAPRVTLDPEMVLVASEDFYGELEAGTTGRFYSKAGSTAGNIITIACPVIEYATVGEGEREGLSVAQLELNAVSTTVSTGDDEVQIAMI